MRPVIRYNSFDIQGIFTPANDKCLREELRQIENNVDESAGLRRYMENKMLKNLKYMVYYGG